MLRISSAPAWACAAVGRPGVPYVLADIDAKHRVSELEHRVLVTGLKVTVFVEHTVVWQETLVVDAGQPSIIGDSGGVEDVVAGVDEADDSGDVMAVGNDMVQHSQVVSDEAGLQ